MILPILLQVIGCGNCDIDKTHWVGRGVGIMNDSMAIFTTGVTEEEYCTTLGIGGRNDFRVRKCKLILADIRKKEIYWEKEIPDKDCGTNLVTVQDSVLFFKGNSSVNRVAFLKLGDRHFQQAKRVELKSKEIKIEDEDWKRALDIKVRPWQDGLMLVNSKWIRRDGNYYALLDTAAETLEPWNPSGEFEWLNACMDARWSSVGGLCLKEIPDTLGFVLLKNGVDTLALRYMPHELSLDDYFWRSRPLIFSGNSILSKGWIYLMSSSGQVSERPLDTWTSSRGVFFDLHGNKVSY
jgi:hypothetical protein